MFKLIRDKVPELVKKSGSFVNYATAENDELYISMLRGKLAEETNEFLTSGSVEELVDIVTVINTILAINKISKEDFEKLYNTKLEKNGGFEKRYIGFFPDTPQAPQNTQQEAGK